MIYKLKLSAVSLIIAGIFVFILNFGIVLEPSLLAEGDINQSFAVVMYHHITEDANKSGDYVVTLSQLENDFLYLKQRGYTTLSVRDLYAIEKGEKTLPKKSIMLTFDDGQESFYKYAFPLLKKFGFSAVLSVIGIYSERFSNINDHNVIYSHVTWDEIKEMLASGIVEIANHSYNMHMNNGIGRSGATQMAGESDDAYRASIKSDIAEFNKLFLKNVDFVPSIYTYPFGRFSPLTADIIKESGFSAAFTCYEKRNVPLLSDNWLLNLGRYNRSGKENTESFFKKLSVY